MKIFHLIVLFVAFFMSPSIALFGQSIKSCDLAVSVISPEQGYIYEFGDTLDINLTIKNNGPQNITNNDTIWVEVFSTQTFRFYNIPAGDSIYIDDIGVMFNDDTADITSTFCVRLLNDSMTYYDSNSINDESCVSFTLKGSGSTNSILQVKKSTEQLNIFPNPTNDVVYISKMPIMGLEPRELIIRDIWGKVVRTSKVLSTQEIVKLELDEINSKGVYLIEVKVGDQVSIGKLLIL